MRRRQGLFRGRRGEGPCALTLGPLIPHVSTRQRKCSDPVLPSLSHKLPLNSESNLEQTGTCSLFPDFLCAVSLYVSRNSLAELLGKVGPGHTPRGERLWRPCWASPGSEERRGTERARDAEDSAAHLSMMSRRSWWPYGKVMSSSPELTPMFFLISSETSRILATCREHSGNTRHQEVGLLRTRG